MTRNAVRWSDEADGVIRGDLTAAVAYVTLAGGAVVTGVATCGIDRREEGVLGFTTSLGLAKKLERIIRDPRVALAYHAREHGFSNSPLYVLAQGMAEVDLRPSRQRLEAFVPQAEGYLGEVRRGFLWDRLLKEYYFERVFVDVRVRRILSWPDLKASEIPEAFGSQLPEAPMPQSPPKKGTAPRVDVRRAARRVAKLRHRVLAYVGSDGFPVVIPVEVEGYDARGLRLATAGDLLPPGSRRAGFLAHAYHPKLVGISTRSFTGWLEVATDGTAVYAPHTSKGWSAPPMKNVLLIMNGLLAKFGYKRALRKGVLDRLERLAAGRPDET